VAINLWKTGGKPTSYNTLPTGWTEVSISGYRGYVMTFRAKSPSSASITLYSRMGNELVKTINLTPVMTTYTASVDVTSSNLFSIFNASATDIIIDSIELVQKPLPKLTINGVDGFASGKWTIHSEAQVLDDETLVLTPTNTFRESKITIPVLSNTPYTISASVVDGDGAYIGYRCLDSNSVQINAVNTANNSLVNTLTTPSNCVYLQIFITNRLFTSKCTFKRPMLNIGTTSVPYSRKTGDKMVLPVDKGNGTYQLNKKPRKYVPRKNMFNKLTASTDGFRVDAGTGTVLTSSGNSYSDWIAVKPNTRYTASNLNILGDATGHHCAFYDANKTYISGVVSSALTSPSNAVYLRISFTTSLKDLVQLEEGSTVTPYEAYALVLPKPRTGLSFNGVSDYLQLPSMTMDSIEIDCLVDSVQPDTTPVIFHNGGTFDRLNNTYSAGFASFSLNGNPTDIALTIPTMQRVKLNYKFTSSITGLTTVFSATTNTQHVKGILYKVTCYLNGGVVAQYDFENSSNVVGNTVLPKADNLIPSFEDPRWTLHANTQVLGKNALRLNSTGSNQSSFIDLPAQPNEVYYGQMVVNTGDVFIRIRDINNTQIDTFWPTLTKKTLPANTASLRFEMRNVAAISTSDFVIPKLFKLDGKEGTLNGTPAFTRKQTKRALYPKR
jgi:hypothetical protein